MKEVRFAHTSVAGAGSLARRAAFLAQRVFESVLIYVEPVLFGFNLITGIYQAVITRHAGTTKRRGTKKPDGNNAISSTAQSDEGTL